jgi:hypothetical protein
VDTKSSKKKKAANSDGAVAVAAAGGAGVGGDRWRWLMVGCRVCDLRCHIRCWNAVFHAISSSSKPTSATLANPAPLPASAPLLPSKAGRCPKCSTQMMWCAVVEQLLHDMNARGLCFES